MTVPNLVASSLAIEIANRHPAMNFLDVNYNLQQKLEGVKSNHVIAYSHPTKTLFQYNRNQSFGGITKINKRSITKDHE